MTGLVPASVLLREPAPTWLAELDRFADAFAYEDAPADLKDRVQLILLDCIGVIASGMQEPETRALAARFARAGQGQGIAVGAGLRLHAGEAAFLNGVAGTMLELDEGNPFARGHPGIHVLPALLSGAGGEALDGAGFLRAFLLGYEVGARVAVGARQKPTVHPHGTWGTIGAAAAAALAEGSGIAKVVPVAAAMCTASPLRAMLEGATVRNAYAGLAARNGLCAQDLAASGFTGEIDGVRTVFEGILGDGFDVSAMTDGLGTRWEPLRNYFKRHAACRFAHGALDIVVGMLVRREIAPEDVAHVEVATYAMAAQLDGTHPATMLGAKFSIPFAVATTIIHGAASVTAFREPALSDPRIAALSEKVRVVHDPAMTARLPAERPARVVVSMTDGTRLAGETGTNRGDASDPYSRAEIEEKFRDLAAPVWGADHAEAVALAVARLGDRESLANLRDLLAAPPSEGPS